MSVNYPKEKATCLSKYIWQLKREETDYTINWSVACEASPYTRETKKCQLCTMEKTLIALQSNAKGLNRRREILTKCWHKDKHLLANWVEVGSVPIQEGQIAGQQGGGQPVLVEQGDGELRDEHSPEVHTDPDESAGGGGVGSEELSAQGGGDLRGGLEEHPDPDESPGGEEGGGLCVQEELYTAGPMTRSKAKKKRKQ